MDGSVGPFLAKHKKKLLIGAGIVAVGLGVVLYIKHSRTPAKRTPARAKGLSGAKRSGRRRVELK